LSVKLPETLQKFGFGSYFNNKLSNIIFPLSLITLDFGHKFNQSISDIDWYEYKLLSLVKFGLDFRQKIDTVKFNSISVIIDYSNRITIESSVFPRTLHKIIWHKDYEYVLQYERKTGQFTKAAIN
jgi:hypothetical protein